MPNKSETKSYGSIRKFKSYGACGVIIGMAALSLSMNAGVAHAEEKVNPNPATNSIPLQDSPTANANESQAKTGTEKGSLDVAVNNDTLKNEVNKAKKAGVEVVEAKPKEITVASDKVDEAKAAIEKDYQTQAEKVKTATEKYEKDVANRKNEVTIVEKRNEAAEAKYKEKLAEIKKQEEALKAKGVFVDNDQVTVYGKLNESKRGSLDYYSDLSVVFKNKENNLETVKDGLGATAETTLELVDKIKVDTARENLLLGTLQYSSGNSTGGHILTGIEKGSTFILHNVGKTSSGKTISAKLTSRSTPTPQFPLGNVNRGSNTSLWVWWDKDKIQKEGKSEVGFNPYNYLNVEWDIEYFDEATKKPLNLGTVSIYADVDWGQILRHTYNNENNVGTVINPPGSQVVEVQKNGKTYWKGDKRNGVWDSDDPTGLDQYRAGDSAYGNVKDVAATPEGTIVSIGSGTKHGINYNSSEYARSYSDSQMAAYRAYYDRERDSKGLPRYSDEELYRADYAFQLWGGKSVINTIVVPPKPEYEAIPSRVTPPKVDVQYTNLKTNVKIEKHVKNSNNVDVNNSSVPKLSEVVWDLEAKPLAAGREETTILQYTDDLPKGFVLDVAKTQSKNPEFNVKYTSATHSVLGTLKDEGLAKANKDRNSAYTVPTLKLYGTVVNDAATYRNNYHLNVNNKFDVYSNTVVVTTPGDPDRPKDSRIKPVKVNYNKDHVKIDGKQVLAGSTNYYHINLDYDQYKGIKSGADAIQKGFGAVDDYPEEALDLLPNEIKYVETESGKEVKGITAYQFKSIEEVKDAKVKAILESSKIKPKGAFQVFVADDAQSFYDKYVSKGISVTVIDPMKVKSAFSGKYENKAYQIDFGNGYEADLVKNNVPAPTPHKKNLNSKGVDINGKPVVAGTVNYYTLTADYSSYKGIEADADRIANGFHIVDDFPEEAVTVNEKEIVVKDSKGNVVTGLKSKVYKSLADAPKGVQESLKSAGYTPKGAIQVLTAENPTEFYNKYVRTGEVLTITNPMTVRKEMLGKIAEYKNTAYQLDFGLAKVTETVVNKVVKPTPKKANFNKAGVNIDGKQVFAGSINYYHVTADYSQYKGIQADKSRIAQGFFIADDYPEDVLDVLSDGIKLSDSKGQDVKGLKYHVYESIEKAPEVLRNALTERGFKPKGAFQVWEAENPAEFYAKYVQTGDTITIINPMKVKEKFSKTGGKYENTAYQVDFGVAEVTVTVVNNIPKFETKKDVVVSLKDKESKDGKEIVLGQKFFYSFDGSLITANRAEDLFEYKFVDDYQETHDRFDGVYKVIAKKDFKTSDGKTFKKGDDLTSYSFLKEDKTKGKLEVGLKEEFLRSITNDSEFQAEVFVEMTRIKSGEVENKQTHVVNGIEVESNTVKTTTPEPPKPPKTPETPTPKPQTPAKKVLPNTGADASVLGIVMAGITFALGAIGLKRKRD